jgi:hypothetical protein
MGMNGRSTGEPRGQIAVMSGLILLGIIVVGAIVLDGGLSWQRERAAQDATDEVARAGLAALHAGSGDGTIWQSVLAAAAEREIRIVSAEYTDARGVHLGEMLGPHDGVSVPAAASGIHVLGTAHIDGFLAPIIGVSSFDIHTRATALAPSR